MWDVYLTCDVVIVSCGMRGIWVAHRRVGCAVYLDATQTCDVVYHVWCVAACVISCVMCDMLCSTHMTHMCESRAIYGVGCVAACVCVVYV